MEKQTFDFLLDSYKQSFKEFGANAPITVTIQQTMTRFFKHKGQTAIADARRELSAETAVPRSRATDETEAKQMVAFVHPKAKPTAEITAQPAVGTQKQEVLPKVTPPDTTPQRPGPKAKGGPVVDKKGTAEKAPNLPDNQTETKSAATSIPASDFKALAGLRPTDVVDLYNDETIIATIKEHFPESKTDGLRPKQLAALLLELVKGL